jgi:hypothetical protein
LTAGLGRHHAEYVLVVPASINAGHVMNTNLSRSLVVEFLLRALIHGVEVLQPYLERLDMGNSWDISFQAATTKPRETTSIEDACFRVSTIARGKNRGELLEPRSQLVSASLL